MQVEMLQSRMYRGEALDAGRVTEMDDLTAAWFIQSGWARRALDAPVMTAEAADEAIPVGQKRRNARR